MRAVLLTNDAGNQMALAHKLGDACTLVGIVLSRNIPRKRPPPARRLRLLKNRMEGRLLGRPFVRSWFAVLDRHRARYGGFPEVPILRVENVNDEATLRFLEELGPELVIVSGTNLVGRRIIEWGARRAGVVNLHTGISPYVKGGPNCTNWCLAEGIFHLIGNTVMWLDPGIDTGPIIATERTPLDGSEDLETLHWKVMEHAHDLYVRVVARLAAGARPRGVPQNELGEGRIYYTVEWDARAMLRAWRNFMLRYSPRLFASDEHRRRAAELRLVSVDRPAEDR